MAAKYTLDTIVSTRRLREQNVYDYENKPKSKPSQEIFNRTKSK